MDSVYVPLEAEIYPSRSIGMDEVLGLGPIQDLLKDPEITEIMVNSKDQIFVEVRGKLYLTSRSFVTDLSLLGIIERIVSPLGRRIDESVPMVDARLRDGSRVNAIIPPLSLKGPVLTIRKFAAQPFTSESLVKIGTLTPEGKEELFAIRPVVLEAFGRRIGLCGSAT